MTARLPNELLHLILSELGTSLTERDGPFDKDACVLCDCCLASKGLLGIARTILYGSRNLSFFGGEPGSHVHITDDTLRQSLSRLIFPHLRTYTRSLALSIQMCPETHLDLHLLPVTLHESFQSSPNIRSLQIEIDDSYVNHVDAFTLFTNALCLAAPPLHTFINISSDNNLTFDSTSLQSLLHALPHLKVLRLDVPDLTGVDKDTPAPRFNLRSLTVGFDYTNDPKHTLPFLTSHSTTSLRHLSIHDNTTSDHYDLAPLSSLTSLELGLNDDGELNGSLTALNTLSAPSLHTFAFNMGRESTPILISLGWDVLEAIPRTAKVVKVQAGLDNDYFKSFLEEHRDELEWKELWCEGSVQDWRGGFESKCRAVGIYPRFITRGPQPSLYNSLV